MFKNSSDAASAIAPQAPSEHDRAVFDQQAALDRLDGDEQLLAMLVRMYHEDSQNLMQQLEDGLRRGDLSIVRRTAHSLKGLVANFEATRARDAALAVEELADSGKLAAATLAAHDLREHLQTLRRGLTAWQRTR
jgi:HPt (histidine-containing phosphotransfer) domain-containing protein